MNKRKEKLRAKIGAFMRQYARKAQRGQEPNDRGYSRALEAKLKRMRPEELDELLNGEQDDPAAQPRPGPDTGQGPLRRADVVAYERFAVQPAGFTGSGGRVQFAFRAPPATRQ
jgi:hypothetical protein